MSTTSAESCQSRTRFSLQPTLGPLSSMVICMFPSVSSCDCKLCSVGSTWMRKRREWGIVDSSADKSISQSIMNLSQFVIMGTSYHGFRACTALSAPGVPSASRDCSVRGVPSASCCQYRPKPDRMYYITCEYVRVRLPARVLRWRSEA